MKKEKASEPETSESTQIALVGPGGQSVDVMQLFAAHAAGATTLSNMPEIPMPVATPPPIAAEPESAVSGSAMGPGGQSVDVMQLFAAHKAGATLPPPPVPHLLLKLLNTLPKPQDSSSSAPASYTAVSPLSAIAAAAQRSLPLLQEELRSGNVIFHRCTYVIERRGSVFSHHSNIPAPCPPASRKNIIFVIERRGSVFLSPLQAPCPRKKIHFCHRSRTRAARRLNSRRTSAHNRGGNGIGAAQGQN